MTATFENLLQKIQRRSAVIGILGMGYVGQPLALRYAAVGYKVIGFDIDGEKVSRLNRGSSGIEHTRDRVPQSGSCCWCQALVP